MGIDNNVGMEHGDRGTVREQNKQSELKKQYSGLDSTNKEVFGQKQKEVASYFGKLVNINEEIPNLLPEEKVLLDKTRKYVAEQRNLAPNEVIIVGGYSQPEDKMVYDNLINRWAMAETTKTEPNLFEKFKRGSGESNGDFWWHQSVNKEADRLKNEGKFKWGEERIYFDVPIKDMGKLAQLTEEVAGNEKIAVGFKYLDLQKTAKVNLDGNETRFVANFTSVEEAKRFHDALAKKKEYQDMKPDRQLDYAGFKIDDKANYANGFREIRSKLKNIKETAVKNPDGTYSYMGLESKKKIVLESDNYKKMMDDYHKIPDPKVNWQKI